MKQKKQHLTTKRLECVECGCIQSIQRRESKDKKDGHIKHLWCIVCERRVEHKELPHHQPI